MTIIWCTSPGWRKAHAVPAQVGRIVDAPALCSIKPDDGWRLAGDGTARCGTCLRELRADCAEKCELDDSTT